jgi:hypothetical protein
MEEDVHKFQELDSDDEKIGVLLDRGAQQGPKRRQFSPDELYFNDMDISAWERRTKAVEGLYDLGYDLQEEDEGYYDDAGNAVSRAEYEDLLFRRVLDKIRVARASGNSDVQLSPEEIEVYQSRLHGQRSPPARSQQRTRRSGSPVLDDAASVLSANSRSDHAKSKSKKSQRTSLFSSKPKKEKPMSRKRAVSNVSSGSSQVPPGFVAPGLDGQPIYTPINPYQGNSQRDPRPSARPSSRSASGNGQAPSAPSRMAAARDWQHDVPGAFPGAFVDPTQPYRPESPLQQEQLNAFRYPSWEGDEYIMQPEPAPPPKLIPFPVQPYQYQSFSPSSSSQPSPQLQYTRRPSAPPSEASYTSMPRRVPVPSQEPPPVTTYQPIYPDASYQQPPYSGPVAVDQGYTHDSYDVVPDPVPVQAAKASGNGKDGERRRKGGKTKKKT